MNFNKLHILLFTLSIFAFWTDGMAQKTDTIYHINGDILTGELKRMNYGIITYKMDGMGTISIEEIKVNTIKSKKYFEVKMNNGLIYFGSIDSSNTPRTIKINTLKSAVVLPLKDIVEMYPIKGNFWMRTSGKFGIGVNYSKGSDITTTSISGEINYRKRNTDINFSLNDNNTFENNTWVASKTDILFSWQRLLKEEWSVQLGLAATQNTELGTKLRVSIDPIAIKDITYNHWNRLYAGAGLSIMDETSFGEEVNTQDLAGLFQVVWKVYKFTLPKINVSTDVSYLPYFTDGGRHRLVFNLNPSISILNDNFGIGFKSYYTYDTKPSTSASSKSDYGINLELSYKFH